MPPLKGPDRGSGNKGNKMPQDLPLGPAFEPSYVYKMLQVIHYDAAFKVSHSSICLWQQGMGLVRSRLSLTLKISGTFLKIKVSQPIRSLYLYWFMRSVICCIEIPRSLKLSTKLDLLASPIKDQKHHKINGSIPGTNIDIVCSMGDRKMLKSFSAAC